MNKKTIYRFFMGLCFLGIVVFAFSNAQAQADEGLIQRGNASSYKVYDTTPVILYGPFLLDISETSTTIEWITDTPCQGRVEYGEVGIRLTHQAPTDCGLPSAFLRSG